MNSLTVTAHGSPGSFVRRTQENPVPTITSFIHMLAMLEAIAPAAELLDGALHRRLVTVVEDARRVREGTK